MDDQKIAREKLQRIRQMWLELERLEENSPEYEILTEKIRALSAEYKTLTDAAAKRARSAKGV
jgi:hypothetical protein